MIVREQFSLTSSETCWESLPRKSDIFRSMNSFMKHIKQMLAGKGYQDVRELSIGNVHAACSHSLYAASLETSGRKLRTADSVRLNIPSTQPVNMYVFSETILTSSIFCSVLHSTILPKLAATEVVARVP